MTFNVNNGDQQNNLKIQYPLKKICIYSMVIDIQKWKCIHIIGIWYSVINSIIKKKTTNLLASISGNNVPEKVNDNNHNNDTTKLYLCQ